MIWGDITVEKQSQEKNPGLLASALALFLLASRGGLLLLFDRTIKAEGACDRILVYRC